MNLALPAWQPGGGEGAGPATCEFTLRVRYRAREESADRFATL
jgi:hypothetical protein